MKIFVGGSNSQEAKNDVRKIAMLIEEEGYTPLPWYKEGVFPLGNYMLDSLKDIGMEVDAAILLFHEDDQVWSRKDSVLKNQKKMLFLNMVFFYLCWEKKKRLFVEEGLLR